MGVLQRRGIAAEYRKNAPCLSLTFFLPFPTPFKSRNIF